MTALAEYKVEDFVVRLMSLSDLQPHLNQYVQHLTRLRDMKDIDRSSQKLTAEDKTVEAAVRIFNRSTPAAPRLRLSTWPWPGSALPGRRRGSRGARVEKWRPTGCSSRLEWFMRCLNAVVVGAALVDQLFDERLDKVPAGIVRTERMIDPLLNLLSSRLGAYPHRVLPSRSALAVLAGYLTLRDGHLPDASEHGKLLYWYLQTSLHGRYASSTVSILAQDLHILEWGGAMDSLLAQLAREYGDFDFGRTASAAIAEACASTRYAMTRAGQARSWCTQLALSHTLLGKLSGLQVHFIYPKELLYMHSCNQSQVNAITNYAIFT